ncbi:MAG: hypothetical protein ABF449_07935 [Ethanoligenens sp.]|uniref:hypothetical protein n=1 Tax=Ethanoligenens sp. TaxID=2099655 RepID=UPI0039E9AABD
MMELWMIPAVALLAACGLYFLLCAWAHLPSARAVRVLATLDGGRTALSEALAAPLARPLSRILPLEATYKRQLAKRLAFADMDCSPEYYVAFAIVMALLAAVPAILLLIAAALLSNLFFALFGSMFVLLAVVVFRLEMSRTGRSAKAYRAELADELPKLTDAVHRGLDAEAGSPDVYYVLDRYRHVAGPAMRKELDILIADMATGDREIALNRFESRLSSDHASALCRALIGIDKGEDMQVYLDGLDVQLREWEWNRLKAEAAKRPDELRPASLAMLGSMLVLYAILFGTMIWNSVQVFFQA